MSDWNSNYDRNNNQPPYDPVARDMNAAWGWVAAAVFIVIILAVAFGIGHQPGNTNTASNDSNPPPATRMAPPPVSMAPITPAPTPSTPAQPSSQ
jgi:cell division protein FtsN